MKTASLIRLALTVTIVFVAALIGYAFWHHYMYSPWTRDGRIRAEVVQLAPDVAGFVSELRVEDNQFVRKGDVLMVIDPERYRLALEQAQANLAAAQASERASEANMAAAKAALASRGTEYRNAQAQAQRRLQVPLGTVVSDESRSNAVSAAKVAEANLHQSEAAQQQVEAAHEQALAAVAQAEVAVKKAQLDLDRTELRAPVDGYVTNVLVRVGDYASAGAPRMALVDSHGFYLYGYFEETKLPYLHVGDAVDVRLLADGIRLKGKVVGIARGIADRDNPSGAGLLANVNPVFNWVRLAQRVPVRIAIDPAQMPAGMALVAGMTATVVVEPGSADHAR
ncbi:MAG: HlyD family secretion protein [Rudaea sp.]|uniref:HlyD family secretion protein n=1 Tax=Rudaea sp. TaxID=2136325 RepID=UPI0039E63E25